MFFSTLPSSRSFKAEIIRSHDDKSGDLGGYSEFVRKHLNQYKVVTVHILHKLRQLKDCQIGTIKFAVDYLVICFMD